MIITDDQQKGDFKMKRLTLVSMMIFPSEGIALAFALYFGKQVWPGIFIGQFFIAYLNNMGIFPSLLISSINSLEAIIAVILFSKWKLNKNLSSYRDFIGLFLMIIFILQPFSAILSNLTLWQFGIIENKQILSSVLSWWFGNTMGQFLYTPFLLTLFSRYKDIDLKDYLIAGIIWITYIYILVGIFHINSLLLILALTLPPIIYITFLRNISYGLFANVLISNALAIFDKSFISNKTSFNVIDYDLYVLISIVVIYIAGVIFDTQKKEHIRLQKIIEQEVEKNKKQQLLMMQQNRLAQMGEMISMIAHQWRQPLNNLAVLHQLIYLKYKRNKLDDKEMERFKNNTTLQVTAMSKTIDDFRNFFKPKENKKNFLINDVITNAIKIVEPLLNQHKIQIIKPNKINFTYFGYSNMIEHAILIILVNAKDALMEKKLEDKRISIEVDKKDNELIITISDNAGGVDKAIIDKIFDPYFSTKNEKNGTGLGLYMAKMMLTEYLNSDIYVHNNSEGAVFSIVLRGDFHEKLE